jgi:hypothetical protein
MNKDAYYFPHFANARHDRKLRRVRKELGIEGYAIYFMTLEVLREQEDFAYPLQDLDLLADDFGTSEAKVEAIVTAYNLFKIDNDRFFYSPKLIEYLKPYLERSNRARNAALKRWHGDSDANALPEHSKSNASKVKESKVKEIIDYVGWVKFWNEVNGSSCRITDTKREQIRSRLRTYSEEELKRSIQNRAKDDWINGEGRKFKEDWNSFWRNDEKPERYLKKQQSNVIDGGTL